MAKEHEAHWDEETKKIFDSIPEEQDPPKDSERRTFTNFAQKRFIKYVGGNVHAPWFSSFTAACNNSFPSSYISKAAIISLTDVGVCKGNMIVKCDHY